MVTPRRIELRSTGWKPVVLTTGRWRQIGGGSLARSDLPVLLLEISCDTHRTSRSSYDRHSMIEIVSIEIWHLSFCDHFKLIVRKMSDFCLMSFLRSRCKFKCILNPPSHRRLFCIEIKTSIFVDIDHCRKDFPHLIFSLVIKLFTKFGNLDTGRPKGCTYWRCWIRLSCLKLELDDFGWFLSHN